MARVAHVKLDPTVDEARPDRPLDVFLEQLGERSSVARGPHRHDRVRVDALLERRRGVEGEDLAVVHDRDAVTELVRLLHVVSCQHDRLTLLVQIAEDLPQREAALRVEPSRRLVHEEDGGAMEDRPCDHEPLRHAAGQGVNARLGPLGQHELLE